MYRTFPCSSGLKELQTKRRPGVFSRVSTRSWQNPSRGQEKGAETTAKVSAGHPKVALTLPHLLSWDSGRKTEKEAVNSVPNRRTYSTGAQYFEIEVASIPKVPC